MPDSPAPPAVPLPTALEAPAGAIPAQAAAEDPALPLRQSTEIQGDILAGFKKDHVRLLLLAFTDRALARTWLDRLRARVATTRDVAAFNAAFRNRRQRMRGAEPQGLYATWRAVSLTYPGLTELVGGEPVADVPQGTTHDALRQGAAARKDILGDTGTSDPAGWLFGGPENAPVHAVLTLAADRPEDLDAAVAEERAEADLHGLTVVFDQPGATLAGERRGNEHFGFKDAISQPAVRDFDEADPEDPEHALGKPGTRVIPAGEFVIGHPMDNRLDPGLPSWMADGSFHVVRRLAQDVPGWWAQAADRLADLKEAGAVPADAGVEWLAARLVGRWRSGTPIAKSPDADVPSPPGSEADNDVSYADDLEGRVTPLFSHARKVGPRDGLLVRHTAPGPLTQRGALDGRRVMRRGVPYGDHFDPAAGSGHGPDSPRGLVFVSYQSDLVAQFEFMQRVWVHGENFPERDARPGRDTVIGGEGPVSFPAGGAGSDASVAIELRQFVRTEGTLYAFTPSLTALRLLAEGAIPPGGEPPRERVLSAPATIGLGAVISSGKARLRFQDRTGQLTVHDENELLRWSTEPSDLAVRAELRENGELILRDERNATLWTSGTDGHPGATLVVALDGDVLIRSAEGETLWHTGTAH
ncbi:Dyp-type peroxidase [Streptomyces sp. DSM 44917]|uniref:Dyp-type peroxidase n=1 Tax=Streptomyces boetiae TaxID=3075541 RepID=A0ABU2L4W8_9ACTN|nr:Dyp-type peroxidase [Streptomyces sp. DSM 44917]MDT0306601.1 Dyp-type peroxidase [Streptomyces sp. DSM 44917]